MYSCQAFSSVVDLKLKVLEKFLKTVQKRSTNLVPVLATSSATKKKKIGQVKAIILLCIFFNNLEKLTIWQFFACSVIFWTPQ